MYLITRDKKYAKKAKEWLELLSKTTIENPWTCLDYIPTAAIAYARQNPYRHVGRVIYRLKKRGHDSFVSPSKGAGGE